MTSAQFSTAAFSLRRGPYRDRSAPPFQFVDAAVSRASDDRSLPWPRHASQLTTVVSQLTTVVNQLTTVTDHSGHPTDHSDWPQWSANWPRRRRRDNSVRVVDASLTTASCVRRRATMWSIIKRQTGNVSVLHTMHRGTEGQTKFGIFFSSPSCAVVRLHECLNWLLISVCLSVLSVLYCLVSHQFYSVVYAVYVLFVDILFSE